MCKRFVFWFDIENAPDVLFFEPIATCLLEMKHKVYFTYRNYSGVPELLKIYALDGDKVGWFGGENKVMKIAVGLIRSCLLSKWSKGKGVDIAVGFGSRPLAVSCGLSRIPNATIFDYEHVSISALNRFCDWIFVPQEVSTQSLTKRGTTEKKIIKYSGLKEEVYTSVSSPDKDLLKRLGYDENKIIVTVRPPATKAHYHDHISVIICRRILETISRDPSVLAILMTRDGDSTFDKFLCYENIKRLEVVVKGLDLIASSDIVISGGGTMVREAVALGIPAYSIFTGKQGVVDKRLSQEGRLMLIRKPEDIVNIRFNKRDKETPNDQNGDSVLRFFVSEFLCLAHKSKS